MRKLPILQSGDTVEIIAPASRCSDQQLTNLRELLCSWGLNCIVDSTIFGEDLLCANHDKARFASFKRALYNPEVKAIICARGGYGSMRLIPELSKMQPPLEPKLFVGMSDITALQLFLQQKWQWPSLHGALAADKFSPESIAAVKAILFGDIEKVVFQGLALNSQAERNDAIDATVIGGNLTLVQASIGTQWQLQGEGRIILLEEVGERAYRIDRMLEHLRQAGVFNGVLAIVFGDFLGGEESDGSSLIEPVLRRFAQSVNLPVVKIDGIGHGYVNFPIPLGTEATIHCGQAVELFCSI
ncbi:LD-carboxypeptidase [Legionella lansingensis]|uniref:LD-carboxypeptidase n=1 Tax=Legionella lansingensis TaxID=45067 RepID=A0A0W0VZY8_9GAMM|nr:LD-carboxypeptidase [Legionella lansingensis]KTD25470.1 LD-carboxypeptidase [Legionella lansingensis]SNV51506.1 LD-carboxypeptidase [Legionella lansingensis]